VENEPSAAVKASETPADQVKRRLLPAVPCDQKQLDVTQQVLTAEEVALISGAEQQRKVKPPTVAPSLSTMDDVPAVRSKHEKHDKKRPSSALVETCDAGLSGVSRLSPLQAKAHRIVSAAISKSPLERHRDAPLLPTPGKSGDVSPSQMRREGTSWGFGRQKTKAKDQFGGGDNAAASGQTESLAAAPVPDKKDKRRSILALLMPSKGSSEKRDRSLKESPPVVAQSSESRSFDRPDIVASREKTKSLPVEKKGISGSSASEDGKQGAVEKRRPKTVKLKGNKKGTAENLNAEGQGALSMRTVYEEMAPIMEGIKHVERRNREKASIHERIQAVAPPPSKAPNTALLPPKADSKFKGVGRN
jgi:hypothetical protein